MSVVDLQPGFYDWAFFAMDSSTNYATPTHVPFVSAATLTWCPSESGTYQASSTDTGTQALLLTPSGKDQVQTSATPLGSTTPLPLATVAIGTSYSLRFSAVGSDGEYRSVPHPFVASDASLAVLAQPTGVAGSTVGLGANAVFGFNAYAWPAFEAAVDTDPVPSSEAWSPIAVSANGPASTVSKSMGSAGAFKLRVRPVVSDCSPAAWIESNEFTVGGGARYVSQAVGSDSNDGTSRVSPYQTLDKALAVAHGANTLDIYVAQGTYTPTAPPRPANYNWSHWQPGTAQIYTQGLVVPASTRIFGGYASDFLSRDPALIDSTLHAVARAHETIIQGDLWSEDYEATGYDSENCHTAITALTGTGGIALDGLTIQATGAEDTDQTGVFLGQFVDMQINNCHLRGTTTGSNGKARGLEARCGVPLRFTNNWFEPHGNHASEEAVKIECAAHPTPVTLTGNLMTATNGLNVSQNNFASAMVDQPLFTIDHNRIMYNTSPGAPTDGNSIGFICSGAVRLGFTHNILTPGFNVFALSGATAFISTDHCFGVVSDNLIDGGSNVNSSNAFQIAGAIPLPVVGHPAQSLLIANNIISAGSGSQNRNGIVARLEPRCAVDRWISFRP